MTKILITGATGRLGSEVVEKLIQKVNPSDVAVLVRDPAKVEHLKAKGVEVLKGDYSDYASLVTAFQGVDKMFFVSGNDMLNRMQHHTNIVNASKETGIKHIVYTSFQRKTEDGTSPCAKIADVHLHSEKLIKESGIPYTFLKNGLYADIISTFVGDKLLETGTIYVPTGEGKTSFALRSDLADGSIAVLTGLGHENKTYEFSADSAWSFTEIAKMISEISGVKVVHVSPDVAEYKAALTSFGVPEMYVGMLAGFAEAINQGEFDFPDDTLSKLIGRKSFDLYAYLKTLYSK